MANPEFLFYALAMSESFSLPSFAKVNLQLRILGKRADGFHELVTVFQTVSLHDTITFSHAHELSLTCDDPSVPTDERNLVITAAQLLRAFAGINNGAAMHLEKRIPSPGGLGGGSSNAAVALLGLTKLWKLQVSATDLQLIGAKLGSDVPFFLHGGTAIGTGRGEIVETFSAIAFPNMLIVTPDVNVSTQSAFADLGLEALTRSELDNILVDCRNSAGLRKVQHFDLINDFEPSVFRAHPEIGRVKDTLLELGAVNAAMSGSGASVFAIFDKTETRQIALNALASERDWRTFAVAAVSRSEYRDALQ